MPDVDKRANVVGRKRSAVKPLVSVRVDGGFDRWLTDKARELDRDKSWILKKLLALGRQQFEEMTNNGGTSK